MTQRINDFAPLHTQQGSADMTHDQASGVFMGEKVAVLQDATSLMADSAEEMTFSASEDVERKLSDRKESKDKLRNRFLTYLHACQDLNKHDLDQFMQQVKAMPNAKGKDLAQLVRQSFSDPTHQHAALSYARGNTQEFSPEALAAFDDALETLEREQGQAILAGYNIVDVTADGLDQSPAALRILYRDTLIDFESYEKTFRTMIEKFGPDELPAAVQYLIRALGADMNALTPSTPKAAIKEVVDGLYMVESLGTVYKETQKLLEISADRHGPHGITERQIIEPVLRYKDIPMVIEMHLTRDLPFLHSANATQDVELTQGIREIVRKMPHKVFSSSECRLNTLSAFQDLLDKAIDREELEAETQ
jgi:type III secretion regulator YopN/LcrE/InvE/MxiC